MSTTQIVLFFLAVMNLIGTSIAIYYKKSSLAVALSIIEIILVYLSMINT